jgi:septal ring factor EnvC (AmiA/AmiB activator)
VKPEYISLIGTALTALGLLAGVIYTQRQVRKAQARTAEIEKAKVDAGSYETARKNFESIIGAQGLRIDRLAKELDDMYEERDSMKKRIDELEAARQIDERNIRILAMYCRRLMNLLEQNGLAYPTPPPVLIED